MRGASKVRSSPGPAPDACERSRSQPRAVALLCLIVFIESILTNDRQGLQAAEGRII